MRMLDAPKTNDHTKRARANRDQVCIAVALQPFVALSLSARENYAMCIVDYAVKEVENISRDHRSKGHASPILTEAMHAKSLSDQGGIYAKEKAVGEACESRNELEISWVFYIDGAELSSGKDEGSDDKTP